MAGTSPAMVQIQLPNGLPSDRVFHGAYSRGLALHAHGNAHSASDAEGRETFLAVAFLHFIKQRRQHAGTGSADRMADGNGTAVDVDLRCVPTKVLVDRA